MTTTKSNSNKNCSLKLVQHIWKNSVVRYKCENVMSCLTHDIVHKPLESIMSWNKQKLTKTCVCTVNPINFNYKIHFCYSQFSWKHAVKADCIPSVLIIIIAICIIKLYGRDWIASYRIISWKIFLQLSLFSL